MNTDLPTLVNCKAGHSPDFPCSFTLPLPASSFSPYLPFPSPTLLISFPLLILSLLHPILHI